MEIDMNSENYWDEFEYSKLKLLLNREKIESILDVYYGREMLDRVYPISIELHLTDLCNLKCEWCTDKELRKNKATLNIEKIKLLFKEFKETGTGVTLEGGGEPTLHPEFREILNEGNRNRIDMGLITNGSTDISDCVHKLKWVRISLDSSSKEEYIGEKGVDFFEKVMQNLEKIAKNRNVQKTLIGVGYVLTRRNQGSLEELIRRLDNMGVDYIYFRPVEEAGDITPSVEELLDLKKKLVEMTKNTRIKYMLNITERVIDKNAGLPCIAHSLTSIIHANGEVALCEKRREDEIVLGNINEHTFHEIWNSEYHEQITQRLLDACEQNSCSVCRVTGFNMIFNRLENVHSKKFI